MKSWGRVFKIKKKSRLVERRGLRRSTVAHFACKVRGTNIVAAKHAQKIQQGHVPDFRHMSVALTLQAK